jgi:hypothetical protein
MAAPGSKHQLATVVHRFGRGLMDTQRLKAVQVKALHNIIQCRTASLGGHEEVCEHCQEKRYSYNSCGDRHCPKCQATKQALWVEEVTRLTLPIKHYHIIFTVPHALNDVCLWNPTLYYNLLFGAVWRTLHSFGYSEYGVETGAIAVLHSWGQNLSLHPHIHCIVPAAGYSLKGEWKRIGEENFLYPVHALSKTFKGKFLDSLRRKLQKMDMPDAFHRQIQNAYKTDWVVFCEGSLASAEHVIRYLGQYTHRVAISNHRILDITPTHVRFMAKDYRDGARQKPVTLAGEEFLRRFCQHIFPKGLMRIRRYGIYHHTTKARMQLQFRTEEAIAPQKPKDKKQKSNTAELVMQLMGFDPGICPKCKKGRMQVVAQLPRIRAPAGMLPLLLLSKLL